MFPKCTGATFSQTRPSFPKLEAATTKKSITAGFTGNDPHPAFANFADLRRSISGEPLSDHGYRNKAATVMVELQKGNIWASKLGE